MFVYSLIGIINACGLMSPFKTPTMNSSTAIFAGEHKPFNMEFCMFYCMGFWSAWFATLFTLPAENATAIYSFLLFYHFFKFPIKFINSIKFEVYHCKVSFFDIFWFMFPAFDFCFKVNIFFQYPQYWRNLQFMQLAMNYFKPQFENDEFDMLYQI